EPPNTCSQTGLLRLATICKAFALLRCHARARAHGAMDACRGSELGPNQIPV
ncbi:hypothetical protein CEXT_567251, partial [Caerostris extrusa]